MKYGLIKSNKKTELGKKKLRRKVVYTKLVVCSKWFGPAAKSAARRSVL
jgi:hypothetical protein